MSRCSTLGEAAAAVVKVENMEEITVSAKLEHAFGENPVGSDGERYAVSPNTEDNLDECASDNAKLRTCYFRSSTITVSKIKEMEEKGYFPEGEAHAPGAETMPEPNGDKVVMYKDFFYCWFAHASASGPGRYFIALPGIVASVNAQCHRAAVKNFLGSQ
jgi:hypothetical protein